MGAPPCANKGKQTNGARLFRKNLFNCELPDKFNAFRSPCSSVVRRKVRIVLRYRNWATRVGICIAFSAVMQGPVCYPNHGGQSDVMIKKLAPLHQGQCVLEIFRALKAAMNNCWDFPRIGQWFASYRHWARSAQPVVVRRSQETFQFFGTSANVDVIGDIIARATQSSVHKALVARFTFAISKEVFLGWSTKQEWMDLGLKTRHLIKICWKQIILITCLVSSFPHQHL